MNKNIKKYILPLILILIFSCMPAYAEGTPVAITTGQQLADISANLSGEYYLDHDIVLDNSWQPIEGVFNGTLDGRGYAIVGPEMSAGSFGGLFMETSASAHITNMAIIEFNINAERSGGIVYTNRGRITNSYTTNKVNGDSAGGLVYDNYGTITNCFNSGIMRCDSVGGIAYNNYGDISNCYTTARIRGDEVAGIAYNNEGDISSAYYTYLLARGVFKGEDPATKLDQSQLLGQDAYVGFDFENVWTKRGNSYYPYPQLIGNIFFGVFAPGTDEPTYIYDEEGLKNISNDMFGDYELISDISLTGGWDTLPGKFKGNLNGNGYQIKGLTGPLFDTIATDSKIENVGVTDSNITGGGVIGINNKGKIYKCFTHVNISGEDAAGIIYSNSGTISNCYTKSNISATNSAGIAAINSGTIDRTFNIGSMTYTGLGRGITLQNTGSVTYSYYLSKYTDSVGSSIKYINKESSYSGFDFNNIWTMREYPMFKSFPSTPDFVAKVTGVKLKNTAKRKVTITWSKVRDISGYQLCMSTKKNGKYSVKTTTKTKYIKKKLKKGKTYYFKVRAYKKDIYGKKLYGAYSGVKKIKIKN